MPPIKTYTVQERREVKVSALSPAEAVHLGAKVFREDVAVPEQRSEIREIEIEAREDY